MLLVESVGLLALNATCFGYVPAPWLLGLVKFGRRPARPNFEVGLAGHVESPSRTLCRLMTAVPGVGYWIRTTELT